MTTAVDSSILLDVAGSDRDFGERSREVLRRAYDAGALVACEVVWAEVRAHYPGDDAFAADLRLLGVRYDPLGERAAALAGRLWRARRGPPRERVIADFLVGAHALEQAERLLTRDRGFYRTYFAELEILEPG